MHRGTALALGVVCWVLLSSCQSDDAEPGARGSTEPTETSVTTPAATKLPPSSPTPPEMPTRASQKSTAGAKAFVAYYIDVLNYSHSASSVKMLESVSADDCGACHILSGSIETMAQRGGGQSGGAWTPVTIRMLPGDSSQPNFVVRIEAAAGTARLTRHSPLENIEPRTEFIDFRLDWAGGFWLTNDLSLG